MRGVRFEREREETAEAKQAERLVQDVGDVRVVDDFQHGPPHDPDLAKNGVDFTRGGRQIGLGDF